MKQNIFRLTTGVAAAYHLFLGAALLVLPPGMLGSVTRVFLGTELEFSPQVLFIGKFVAAYLLVFGVMLGLLSWNPVRLRALVIPALVLFGIRLVNKLVFLNTIEETFGVSRGRSVFAVVTLAVIFAVMAWSRPAAGEAPKKP